ncbi:hypothetical protein BOX15_Mlig015481g1 [Macrostomum lignano]|uniref:Uncharacterized protein n=1 Tax=Macrostomum lignano TaxID=282301 RepID=A0A267H1E0_9PLAT|nr:hypothetical protein BOX15_Mlig015481g1 [Macrostomum lignano]
MLYLRSHCWSIVALLLMWRPTTTTGSVLATWSSLGQWATSSFDNYTQYTFRYKAFDPVRLVQINEQYNEAEEKCASTQTRLPRLEDLAGELFQQFILKNPDFRKVGVTKEVIRSGDNAFQKIRQWSVETGQFFLASKQQSRQKQLIELGDDKMILAMQNSDSMDIVGQSKQPTIIMCVKERYLPRPPPPPPPKPPAPVAPSSSSSNVPCACGSGGVSQAGGGSGLDFAWPLAAVAFLGVLCLSLATALLIVCRTKRRRADEAAARAAAMEEVHGDVGGVATGVGKNGNSIPRTASSLMDFPGGQHHYHMQEKAHSLAAQATMPRRPRVIHHGQVHTNGYLTLGSIQARKQRELMHHPGPRDLGLSEPPSPNHSIARSDYQHR